MATDRPEVMPEYDEETGEIHLYGVGPRCPECDGPTHRVAENEYEKPWFCVPCSVRVDNNP